MTEALANLSGLSEEEGHCIVRLYKDLGGILGLFSDLGLEFPAE
jgi:hypothetical protein